MKTAFFSKIVAALLFISRITLTKVNNSYFFKREAQLVQRTIIIKQESDFNEKIIGYHELLHYWTADTYQYKQLKIEKPGIKMPGLVPPSMKNRVAKICHSKSMIRDKF